MKRTTLPSSLYDPQSFFFTIPIVEMNTNKSRGCNGYIESTGAPATNNNSPDKRLFCSTLSLVYTLGKTGDVFQVSSPNQVTTRCQKPCIESWWAVVYRLGPLFLSITRFWISVFFSPIRNFPLEWSSSIRRDGRWYRCG